MLPILNKHQYTLFSNAQRPKPLVENRRRVLLLGQVVILSFVHTG